MITDNPIRKLFGFRELKPKVPDELMSPGPIKQFSRDEFLAALAKYKIGDLNGNVVMGSYTIWGNDSGAIRLLLNSNNIVYIQRQTEDLINNYVWVTKILAKINVLRYAGREDKVAEDMFPIINKIADKNTDGPRSKANLDRIVERIRRMTEVLPGVFKLEEVDVPAPNWKTLQFGVVANGVGVLVKQGNVDTVLSVNLDVFFIPDRGLIKIMFSAIMNDTNSATTKIQVPYFEALFAPTQDPEEIARVATNMVRFV